MADATTGFADRHIGPRAADLGRMLKVVGAPSLDALTDEAIPAGIRLAEPLDLPDAESEAAFLERMRALAGHNEPWRSFIGLGYYGCVTPPVILRNLLENPGWYTPYTPYQAEVAQGRLEALLNFQTAVSDLTGMEIANASLLDEATAAAEAMTMLFRLQARQRPDARRFLVSSDCFPQTIAVVRGRAEPLGIEVDVADPAGAARDGGRPDDLIGVLVQSPDASGRLHDLAPVIAWAHAAGALVVVASDLLALTLLTPPGEQGADVVVGNAQRFGVPLGYGGPHAAFFAARGAYARQMPGRMIGVSVDARGRPAYRMALQTREQHIRRERATSNICTAQALLANVAGMYAAYHGPDGLREIALRVHGLARGLADRLLALGSAPRHAVYFDTLRVDAGNDRAAAALRSEAETARINLRYHADGGVGIALDETTTPADVDAIVEVFARATGAAVSDRAPRRPLPAPDWPAGLLRSTPFLTHPVFHRHRAELQMMRYLKRLERRDIGLDTSMIPLGSCTMKLNAAVEMEPITWPEFGNVHPFAPPAQAGGYRRIIDELEGFLCAITGFEAVSLQPNSGAQGEFAGLLVIRAFHHARGESGRNVVLIPASAHGTNPASAVMAGLQPVIVACDGDGNVDLDDLRAKAAAHGPRLSALMITYPSTHGVFEDSIQEVCRTIHAQGGQVYMDGANLNAQVGLTSPARIGADVCHLNLHKTFAIPHGGGGPGMGPIAVARHLAPFLPRHPLAESGSGTAIAPISAAPWGSASILLISYAYIRLLGARGVTAATEYAILNANYIKARLEARYDVLYARPNGRVAHELIFDLRPLKARANVTAQDVAKRLMDYGFHAPTVSFPVAGTLMVEPTESEPLDELDRFCEAMLAIRDEIEEIAAGRADPVDNVLKNAPHTMEEVAGDAWTHPYSRQAAAFPRPFVAENKVWPAVARIDDAHGDRNLVCACPPVEEYAEPTVG
jgi:glycine dehydrogenase